MSTAGYWNRPEATSATFADGWLHTGDVVRVDDAGRVHIVDRLKDIINRGGENVSSVEVEAVLLAAPNVADACVLAVPDDVMGEKVGAVLFAGEARSTCRPCSNTAAGSWPTSRCRNTSPWSTNALPRNAGGKLLKGKLREQVRWGDPLR